jgi:hypothetical protein
MASKTRAALNPEVLAARAAKRAAKAAHLVLECFSRAAKAKPSRQPPRKAKSSRRPPRKSTARKQRRKATGPPANLNAAMVFEIAAKSAFARKGTASAAAFRPWYWRY